MGNSDFSWKLADHPKLPKGKTVAVVVLDGWGEANPDKYTMDSLKQLLLKGSSEHGAKRIRVHVLTDGRDVLDGSSVGFVETLENDLVKLREKGVDAQAADEAVKVSIAVGGPALAPGVRFLKGVPNDGLAIMNLHGFEAPSKYETTLIAVIDD
ncbi:hypothetical protein GW17_00002556 [Ensete ventricosum]|nr:hypothetical protein GW17_00002556 [Ensete ventricosum]